MTGWFNVVLPVVSVLLTQFLTYWFASRQQRFAYERDRLAKQSDALRVAYVEWATKMDNQFERLVAAARGRENAWSEIALHDAELRTSTYRLLLLEWNHERRAAIKEVIASLPDWRHERAWFLFEGGIQTSPNDPRPEHAEEMQTLLERVVHDLSDVRTSVASKSVSSPAQAPAMSAME